MRRIVAWLYAVVLLLPAGAARAQWTWEPITDDDRQQSASTVDASAGAEALFRRIKIEDLFNESNFKSVRDEYIRIKVFTPLAANGLTQVQIPYGDRGVHITDVAARTILADGSMYDVAAKDMRTINLARKEGRGLKALAFAMPRLQAGAIMEYRYRVTIVDNLTDGAEIDVQLPVPIKRAEIDIKPLAFSAFRLQIMPYSLVANVPMDAVLGWYKCVAENVKGLPEEPFGPLGRRRRGFLFAYYLNVENTDPDKFWGGLGAAIAGRVPPQDAGSADVKALAQEIAGDATVDSLQLQRLVRWCRREIRPMTPEEFLQRWRRTGGKLKVSEVLESRTGTDSDAAQALASLAGALRIRADVVFLESRSGMPFRRGVLSPSPLLVAAVQAYVGGTSRLCSVRAKGVAWDELPWDAEGMKGIVCSQDSSGFMTAQVAGPSLMQRIAQATVHPNGDLDGAMTLRLERHWAEEWFDRLAAKGSPDSVITQLVHWNADGPKLREVSAHASGADSDTVVVSAKFSWPGYATVTEKRILLQPAIWSARQPATFPAKTRQTSVELPFVWSERDSVQFELPAGYKLEGGDRLEPFEAEPLLWHWLGVVKAEGTLLEFVRRIQCGSSEHLTYSRSNYPTVKQAFDAVAERDQYTVTLAKVLP